MVMIVEGGLPRTGPTLIDYDRAVDGRGLGELKVVHMLLMMMVSM